MKKVVYKCSRFEVIEELRWVSGVLETYYYTSKPNAVAALITCGDELLMLDIERVNVTGTSLELPGGRIEIGEEPLQAVCREVIEETGLSGISFKFFSQTYPLPSITNERVTAFHAEVPHLELIKAFVPSDIEGIHCRRLVNLEDIPALCKNGSIACAVDGYFALLLAAVHGTKG